MPNRSEVPVVYWDTSLFISFLTGRDADKQAAVSLILNDLLTSNPPFIASLSHFTRAELRTYAADDAKQREVIDRLFLGLVPGPNIRYFPVDRRIGDLASQIGSEFQQITPPDAIHIATALAAGAKCLWTFDGIRRDGSRRSGHLASFDGKIHGLEICAPDSWKLMPLFEETGAPRLESASTLKTSTPQSSNAEG